MFVWYWAHDYCFTTVDLSVYIFSHLKSCVRKIIWNSFQIANIFVSHDFMSIYERQHTVFFIAVMCAVWLIKHCNVLYVSHIVREWKCCSFEKLIAQLWQNEASDIPSKSELLMFLHYLVCSSSRPNWIQVIKTHPAKRYVR